MVAADMESDMAKYALGKIGTNPFHYEKKVIIHSVLLCSRNYA